MRQNGALSPSLPGTLNITFDSAPSEALLPLLGMDGICVSAGSACASGSPEPSHVLLALGLSAKQARSSIRFSLGADLDEKDIDTIAEIVIGHVTALRNLHHADQ
ncbi:aminotransferase class V-fold PLP-dependent enzyme [Acidaminococcus intestini]|nr:aminotransferase class V-fold PLP-dependent enzyme [Acidaminococcus intestini]